MKKYEYLKINRNAHLDQSPLSTEELNELGNSGWLLVGLTWSFSSSEYPGTTAVYRYIFAREKA